MNKRKCLFLAGVMFMLVPKFVTAQSGAPVAPSGDYTCKLRGTSLHHDPATSTDAVIYDDGPAYYSGGFTATTSLGTAVPWNCGRRFLFTEYTGLDVTLHFEYGDLGSRTTITQHNIIITNISVTPNIEILNTFTGLGEPGMIPSLILDAPGYIFNSSTPGEYEIKYYRDGITSLGTTVNVNAPDIIARVVLIPEVQKLSINAQPVCADFSGAQYNFQVNSVPDFHSIMFQTQSFGIFDPGDGCADSYNENYLHFDFSSSVGSGSIKHSPWLTYGIPIPIYGDEVDGINWTPTLAASTDLNNFWINENNATGTSSSDPNVLAYYLSGGGGYGTNPVINLTYDDGVTTKNISATVLILSPALPVTPSSNPTATVASGGIPGPAHAMGVPEQSYDIYDYTVVGTETWTPTHNPIVTMNGEGATVPTIRIQDAISIPEGTTLILEGGIRLEMGPEATIKINHAS